MSDTPASVEVGSGAELSTPQPAKPQMQQPKTRDEIAMALILGDAADLMEAQKAVSEVLTQMFVTADAVREAMAESARRLETVSGENQRELVAAHRELTQTIRDFEAKAGENLAVPIAGAVGRTVKHQAAKLAVVAGGAALVGSLVGAGIVALLLR